jgi:protein involved in ribonucleotide reduction
VASLVYFSSTSQNTHRFVVKLGIPASRIPIHDREGTLLADEPFVLVVPTYGGGWSISGRDTHYVPKQVVRFLNNPGNRSLLRGVIASGNTNFGESFGMAGDIISRKCQVPYLYRFELMGNEADVARVREGLQEFWTALRIEANEESPTWHPPSPLLPK